MIEPILFVVIALILLLVFAYFATRSRRKILPAEIIMQGIRTLDIDAFRNLMDPSEDSYLQDRLPPAELRAIRRERNRVALSYISELSAVAVRLASLGDSARQSADPAVAAWGREITESATYLRLRTLDARLQLSVGVLFPSLQLQRLRLLWDQVDRASSLAFQRNAFTAASQRAS